MILTSNQVIFFTLVQIFGIQALIVPDEVPSILSIVYSNIPTIKKGTDSRLGYGFRLGDRADIQFLVELGPQTNTRPLANQPDNDGLTRKRSPPDDLIQELYSKRTDKNKPPKTEGGKWLEKWSESYKSDDLPRNLPVNAKPGLAAGEIDAASVIPADDQPDIDRKGAVLRQLQEGREEKTVDDENALANLLKLMERIQEQIAFEKQISEISSKKTTEKAPASKRTTEKAPASKRTTEKAPANQPKTKKDDNKEEPPKVDLIKQTAMRIASAIQNASLAASAVVNLPPSKNEPTVPKSSSRTKVKPRKEKDDMLMSAAQKIVSTVNNASSVVGIVLNPPSSMIFNEINETAYDYSNKNIDNVEVEKGTIMERGAQKLASALRNASVIVSAFPEPPDQIREESVIINKKTEIQVDPIISYIEHFSDHGKATKNPPSVNALENSKSEIDTKPKGRNLNLTESYDSDDNSEEYEIKRVKIAKRKNEELLPKIPQQSTNSSPSVPRPNEGFLQYILRRLGYYDYLMSYVPVVPEATREKVASKINSTQTISEFKT